MTLIVRAAILNAAALGIAAATLLSTAAGHASSTPTPRPEGWLVKFYDQVSRPAAPRDLQGERAALKAIAAKRTDDDLARFRWWSTGGPAYRWNELILDEMQDAFVTLPLSVRHLALFHAALDDAIAAARYNRPSPDAAESVAIDEALNAKSAQPSRTMPSDHAAAAAAAAEVLAYLFPARGAHFAGKAEEAMQVRLLAGVEYPHAIAAGRAIGQQVAALAIARGKLDGSDAKWTGSVPEGAGRWKGTNPVAPAAANWMPWALVAGSEFRPAPPPAFDSEATKAALVELKTFQRTPKTNHRATFWEVNGGARAHTMWNEIARTKLIEYGYAPTTAARVLTALNVAMIDAGIACWDAKYTYWYIRPSQLDSDLKPVFAPPNHPSYPAAHGCFSTAAAVVLAGAFPHDREKLLAIGKEAAEARVWAGIHYRFDIDAGQDIGRKVGERTLSRAFAPRTQ